MKEKGMKMPEKEVHYHNKEPKKREFFKLR